MEAAKERYMEKREEELIQRFLPVSEELRFYYKEHQELESKLDGLNDLSFLTPDQEMERKELQKKKLRGKDKLIEISRQLLEEHSSGES